MLLPGAAHPIINCNLIALPDSPLFFVFGAPCSWAIGFAWVEVSLVIVSLKCWIPTTKSCGSQLRDWILSFKSSWQLLRASQGDTKRAWGSSMWSMSKRKSFDPIKTEKTAARAFYGFRSIFGHVTQRIVFPEKKFLSPRGRVGWGRELNRGRNLHYR